MSVQRGQDAKVLRSSCGLFGADHVGEVGDVDFDVFYANAVSPHTELTVSAVDAGGPKCEVELSVRADEVPQGGSAQRRSVMVEGDPGGLGGTYARIELLERARQPAEVGRVVVRGYIDVSGGSDGRLLRDCRERTDDDVANCVSVENLEDRRRVEV
jgi:hypothetical protein